jgi:hypothetical protein
MRRLKRRYHLLKRAWERFRKSVKYDLKAVLQRKTQTLVVRRDIKSKIMPILVLLCSMWLFLFCLALAG